MLLYTFLWMSIAFTISMAAGSENATSRLIPCNDGWFFHEGGKCYKMFGDTKKLNWKQASEKCVAENGHLATISSYEIQVFLVNFVITKKNNAWIGLQDQLREREFVWEDGSPYTFKYWDEDQPDEGGSYNVEEDCVSMRISNYEIGPGYWNDLPCNSELHFICQANKSDTILSRDPRFCTIEEGEGWKHLNRCYHIVTEAKSWEDAESHCKEIYSGHLVTIIDGQTDLFVNYTISTYDENFWIGLKMRDQDIQMWSPGVRVIYAKYDIRTNLSMAGSCVMKTKGKLWEIGPCDRKLPFICEMPYKSSPILKKAPEGWKCPSQSEEWLDLGGEYCYIFETKNATWDVANYQCVRKGGTLASIPSQAQTHVLTPYLKKYGVNAQVFIGLHRSISNNDVFEWIDGSPLSYTNWNYGEPNDKREECAVLWNDHMRWDDVVCKHVLNFFCSAKKVPPASNVNASVPTECACTSGMSTKTDKTGIIICILLIILLCGVVVYQYRKQSFCRKL